MSHTFCSHGHTLDHGNYCSRCNEFMPDIEKVMPEEIKTKELPAEEGKEEEKIEQLSDVDTSVKEGDEGKVEELESEEELPADTEPEVKE